MLLFFIFKSLSFNYVKETFDDGKSTHWRVPKKLRPFTRLGVWEVSTGECWGHQQKWLGLRTTKSRRDYLIYTNFTKPMNTIESDLIVQYTLRLNPYVDCSGQFIKLMDSSSDMSRFSQDLPFAIKFGPDICGPSFKRVHFVITYNGTEYESNRPIGFTRDSFTHGYTLIIRTNSSFTMLIDGEVVDEGTLEERFDFKKPRNEGIKEEKIEQQQNQPSDESGESAENKFSPNAQLSNQITDEEIGEEEEEIPIEMQKREETNPTNETNTTNETDATNTTQEIKETNETDETNTTNETKENETDTTVKEKKIEEPKEDIVPFGHFKSLGFLGIDVHQSCCGSLFDNFLVTDSEFEAKKMLNDNFLAFQVAEARSCDKGGNGSAGNGNEEGNDDIFNNKEARMRELAHRIDFSNFDPL